MKYEEYYVCSTAGKSNCVVRSFCMVFNKTYDTIYNELCKITKELNCNSYNDTKVFETYMFRNNVFPIEYGQDLKIKDLVLDNGSYIVFCWDKKDYYHMISIIDNVMYDKNDKCLDLYVIKMYKKEN